MKLKDVVQPGDILLFYPRNAIGRLIVKATFGKVNHAAIVVSKDKIFETDGDLGRAKFEDISKYDNRHLLIVRASYMQDKNVQLMAACEELEGKPYSYFDIAVNGVFFWLAAPLKRQVVKALGREDFMVCSELVGRIAFKLSGRKEYRDFEGLVPEDLREIAVNDPVHCQIIDVPVQ